MYKDAGCFILRTFWDNPTEFAEGDVFTFTVNANCTTVAMPVLFTQGYAGATAYTIDHVNCLVDNRPVDAYGHGPMAFTGHPHEYEGDGKTPMTVVKCYVEESFKKAGYTNVVFADSVEYNVREGDIHCGTNARRAIRIAKWWE